MLLGKNKDQVKEIFGTPTNYNQSGDFQILYERWFYYWLT